MSGIRINVEEASNDGREDLVPDVSELYVLLLRVDFHLESSCYPTVLDFVNDRPVTRQPYRGTLSILLSVTTIPSCFLFLPSAIQKSRFLDEI